MARRNLDAARQLISEKRYAQARAILQMSSSSEAEDLLYTIEQLELSEKRLSPFQFPYILMLLLGLILPVLIAIALIASQPGGLEPGNLLQILTQPATAMQLPTQIRSATPRPTASPTRTRTPTRTATPTNSPTPTATPTATRMLPPTWTPTTVQPLATIDFTATALVHIVETKEALVVASETAAANLVQVSGDEVRGIVGTPDQACQNAARLWWRSARLLAADTLFNMVADHDNSIALIESQPGVYDDLRASLGDNVAFMNSLRDQLAGVDYPGCASTARDLILAYFNFRIRIAQAIASSDQAAYETNRDGAETYLEYFERELTILGVPLR